MAAVVVILATKQRGRFVQPGRLQRGEVFGQPVHLLIDVRFNQVKHAPRLEFVFLSEALHKVVGVQRLPPAHVLGQAVAQAQVTAQHVGRSLQIGIAEGEKVQREFAEGVTAQKPVRHEGGRQHVALEIQRARVVRGGPKRPRQAFPADGRLVPLAIQPGLAVVQNLAAVQHRHRVTKGERLGAGLGDIGLGRTGGRSWCGHGVGKGRRSCAAWGALGHQENSRTEVVASLAPSSGSKSMACMQAHAKSAWPVSLLRPAS